MSALTPARVASAPPYGEGLGRQAHADFLVRIGAGLALWASVLLVTFWWVRDGGLQEFATSAGGLTSTGRISGLVASVLLLAQLLLMARVPLLEGAFGQDRLTRIHRIVGFTSFNLMLLHVVAITWGYAAGRLSEVPATLWNLTVSYPGMLLAAAATGLLCLVVVTSVRAARRRLRYESWHLLHLYAYLGAGLALPHQLWTGQQFTASAARTVFWWSAWAAAATAVLVWRVGLPLWRNVRHQLYVTSVVPEAPGIASVYLTGKRMHALTVAAGQFFCFRFLGRPGWTRSHPYSLSAGPDGRSLRITVQVAGDGSADALRLRPGTRVLLEGPYGRLGQRARTRAKVLLLGAGVGMTPIRALAESLPYEPGEALLLQRYTQAPLFASELQILAAERGLEVGFLPGRRRHGASWIGDTAADSDGLSDVDLVRHWVPDLAERDVYLCGPDPWTELVRKSLLDAGLPPEQLHIERFGW